MRLRCSGLARWILSASVIVGATDVASAQVVSPAKPESVHVDLRYRIQAGRDERVRQFRTMSEFLAKLGFQADAKPDADLDILDPTAERLSGTLPSKAVNSLITDPRILTVITRGVDAKLPDDTAKLVEIQAQITSGLDQPEQHQFHDQVAAQLTRLGFRENVGYDHAGYSRVRGAIPAGRVANLLTDLRDQPTGWFFNDIPRDQLNQPFRSLLPLRIIEVLPELSAPPALAIVPPGTSPKYAPDVRMLLADAAKQNQPIRVEFIAYAPIPDGGRDVRLKIKTRVPTASIEGAVGPLLTLTAANAADLEKLAELPDFHTIRLPRWAVDAPKVTAKPFDAAQFLASTGLAKLHTSGYRGAGSRVAIIGTDFTGTLPKNARLIDLTAELSPTVTPLPQSVQSPSGQLAATHVHIAAPEAELLLIRVDPAAIHQIQSLAQAIYGVPSSSIAVQTRSEELIVESDVLGLRRDVVVEEYRKAFGDLSDEDKPRTRRENAQKSFAKLKDDEAAFKAKYDRLAKLKADLLELKTCRVILNTLVWEDGYSLDGMSDLSLLLDARIAGASTSTRRLPSNAKSRPTWVQAASPSVGSVWSGSFLDVDGNGIMEFATEAAKMPNGSWTPEINFLGSIGSDGVATQTIAAGTKLRFSMQWREPRDDLNEVNIDAAAMLSFQLLRQRDPTGKTTATDDLVLVAKSIAAPVRLSRTAGSATYEQSLEVTVTEAGRYAIQIVGRIEAAGLNARSFEIQPRIYVAAVDANGAGKGTVAFQTYAPTLVGVAIPSDAATVVTVGLPNGVSGAGPGITLRPKPDVVVPGVANPISASGLVAGAAACLIGSGVSPAGVSRSLTPKIGEALRIVR